MVNLLVILANDKNKKTRNYEYKASLLIKLDTYNFHHSKDMTLMFVCLDSH